MDDQPVTNFTLENMNQRLEIPLPQPLEPGRTGNIRLNYGLILPQIQAYINASNDVRPQIYGYMSLPAERLSDLRVRMTIVNGEIVFKR